MAFSDDVGDPLSFVMHLPAYVYHVSFLRYRPLKVPLSCEVVEKRWFWGPGIVGEGIPQISDIHFQIALTSQHVTNFR